MLMHEGEWMVGTRLSTQRASHTSVTSLPRSDELSIDLLPHRRGPTGTQEGRGGPGAHTVSALATAWRGQALPQLGGQGAVSGLAPVVMGYTRGTFSSSPESALKVSSCHFLNIYIYY